MKDERDPSAARSPSAFNLHPSSLALDAVDEAVARIGDRPELLIPLLQAIQDHYHYLPTAALWRLAELTDIPPAQITSVATFYHRFRHKPCGKHIVRICHGTACHVKGSERIEDSLRQFLKLPPEQETDTNGQFTLERVGCIGCCTLAPVVDIDAKTFGHLTALTAPGTLEKINTARRDDAKRPGSGDKGKSRSRLGDIASGLLWGKPAPQAPEVRIGCGSCCVAGGSAAVRSVLAKSLGAVGAETSLRTVGCVGMCHQTPLVEIAVRGGPSKLYTNVTPELAEGLLRKHFRRRGLLGAMRGGVTNLLDRLLRGEQDDTPDRHARTVEDAPVAAFLSPQVRLATDSCGQLDPLDIDQYIANGGFTALTRARAMTAEQVVEAITRAGLRGRGGAGFPTGRKWDLMRNSPGDVKYLICNGDEGDPGAFMDRMILESFPFRVLEGMLIAAHGVGATEAILYIRSEYPLALDRVRKAIDICRGRGLIRRTSIPAGGITLRVVEGAGAFVCGEETALIASIEGRRGFPRLRPPFPAQKGLWDKPTLVNNVETFALVPSIIRDGPDAFAALGTPTSKGTKVFALTGKIRRGGLIEVPMGISIRRIVEEIGGGVAEGRSFKAVQIGGPSGGCIPASLADLPVDYESLAAAGAIMGSGGLVVLDDRDCMVDMARYFLQFTQDESCGQCSMCRTGTKVMQGILERFCQGSAVKSDLVKLESLAQEVRKSSLCGLGQTAPNPVLTTLRYFRDEYEAHLAGRCPAGRCKSLIHYRINDRCIGCTICAQHCPSDAIPKWPRLKHMIDDAKCTRCDVCREVCPELAVEVR